MGGCAYFLFVTHLCNAPSSPFLQSESLCNNELKLSLMKYEVSISLRTTKVVSAAILKIHENTYKNQWKT